MRWQKAARLAIAAFVIVFAAIVVVALRRPAPVVQAEPPVRKSPETVAESGPFELKRFDGATLKVAIKGEGQETYSDGRKIGRNAIARLPERNGRTCDVFAPEMELVTGEGGDGVSVGKLTGGVRMTCSDGLEITSHEASYDDKTSVITVPGAVQFTRGRMTGSGTGATYDQTRDVLWLLADARIKVAPDEQGKGGVDATAGAAGLARAEHYVRMTNQAHVVTDGRTIDAQDLTIQLTPDDRLIQSMALRGNSRITGGGAAGNETMSANDIDLTYAPDGRSLQHARLIENAAVEIAGGGGAGPRTISGKSIEMSMGPDGSTVTGLNANQQVKVQLPAAAGAPAREITAATLAAAGASGIETATFTGGVRFREMRPGGRGAKAASERTGRSQRLIVRTQPGLGAIEEADFLGHARIEDGSTVAEAPRALYRVDRGTFDLSPAAGEPGPPPSVNDGRVLVRARTMSVDLDTDSLRAETDVRSSIQPSKRGGPAQGRAGQSGAGTADEGGGKLPAMLKDDEPVNVTANRLAYDGAASVATYTGDAKLFQGQTQIQAEEIVVDDRTGNLTAKGKVRTVMFFEEADARTKTKKPVQTTATGDTMVYDDAKRVATYTTGPTAKAHIVGTQGDVTADRIDLFLKKDSNELERAEADGSVVVKEGARTANGRHLVYTPANETYVMTGSPVRIEERTPSGCRLTEGTVTRFRRTSADDMSIDGNGIAPVMVKQCAASGSAAQ